VSAARDELAQIRRDLDAGRASTQSLVQLYNAASDAEQRRDVEALTAARTLAQQLAEVLDDRLRADGQRLVELCTQLLQRIMPPAKPSCPACGRELDGSPVRCRGCGELLV
jgi:uncharacterized protein with NRDE domain